MSNATQQREVPRNACRFAGGPVRFAETGPDDGAGSIPLRMVARSAQPVEHWYWGRVVHDMQGMQRHKDVLVADYCHEEEIGYLDKFEIDEEQNLIVSGELVATSDPNDRARRVANLARGGVPYEASIDFTGDGITIEEVSAGASVEVNGFTFSGPGAVIRQWPLRGVAVCPHGADMHTSSTMFSGSASDTIRCQFTGRPPMVAPTAPAAIEARPAPTQSASPAFAAVEASEPVKKPKHLADVVRIKGNRLTGERLKQMFAPRRPAGVAPRAASVNATQKSLASLVRIKGKRPTGEALKQMFAGTKRGQASKKPAR